MEYFSFLLGFLCLCCNYDCVEIKTWKPAQHECNNVERIPCIPSVVRSCDFNATADAIALYTAIKVKNNSAIVNIITKRTLHQRLEVNSAYRILRKGRNLIEELKPVLGGNLLDLIFATLSTLSGYFAWSLHKAMPPYFTDENAMIDILGTLSNNGIRSVAYRYFQLYQNTLIWNMIAKVVGTTELKRLYVLLSTGERDTCTNVNDTLVVEDIKRMNDAIRECRPDATVFSHVISRRNFAHLIELFDKFPPYGTKYRNVENTMASNNEFPEDLRKALVMLIQIIKDRNNYFVERLHVSSNTWLMRMDHKSLIRIIVTRSEIDLTNIKVAYKAKYGESLADMLRRKILFFESNYKTGMLNLVGE